MASFAASRPRTMLRHHLPQIVSHLSLAARFAVNYCHAATRALVVALSRFESPRAAFRAAMQRTSLSGEGLLARGGAVFRRESPLLIHYHIFKNAGTSFEWALEQALGSGLRRLDSPSPGGFLSQNDIIQYVQDNPEAKAIASHEATPPVPRIEGRHLLSSILIRDPIARIRSIYAFERNQASNNLGALKAKELDLKGYVQWRLATSPRIFCNFQVYFCCRDSGHRNRSLGQVDLEKAIRALDAIDVVGTVARYDEWLALAQSVLADYFESISLIPAHRNQSAGQPVQSEAQILKRLVRDLGPNLVEELLKQNELDKRLHQVADSLLSRRLAERSVSIRLRDAYGSERAAQGSASEQER